MRPSLALSIGAVFYVVAGLLLLLAPAPLLASAGWPSTPDVALVPARDGGTLLIVLGIIDWLTRNAIGQPLRGVLWGNLLRPIATLVVNGWELAAGFIPASVLGGVTVAGFATDVALIVIFALALRRA